MRIRRRAKHHLQLLNRLQRKTAPAKNRRRTRPSSKATQLSLMLLNLSMAMTKDWLIHLHLSLQCSKPLHILLARPPNQISVKVDRHFFFLTCLACLACMCLQANCNKLVNFPYLAATFALVPYQGNLQVHVSDEEGELSLFKSFSLKYNLTF